MKFLDNIYKLILLGTLAICFEGVASKDASCQPLYLEKQKNFEYFDNSEGFTKFLENKNGSKEDPGFILIVKHKEQNVFSYKTGVENMDSKTPIDNESQFYLASIGKTMTAAAVLKLVESKQIRLEESITLYFNDLPEIFDQVRIYNLLSHTSGLPDHFDILGEEHENLRNTDVLNFLRSQDSLIFEPSVDYSYSNSAYVLLSILVEKVSRKSFAEFMETNFFQPLQMNNTKVFDSPVVKLDHKVSGYKLNEAGKYFPMDYSGIYTTGSGGIYSNLEDLDIWITALTSGLVIKSKRLLNLMFDFPTTYEGYKSYMAMGWTNETVGRHTPEFEGLRVLGSLGFMRGFVTQVFLYPDQELKVIVLSNTGKLEIGSNITPFFIKRSN